MNILHVAHMALRSEYCAWRALLRIPALYLTLLLTLLALVLVQQVPLHYVIDVGVDEGYGSDLPMLSGFNTPEQSQHGSYRWTQDGAIMTLRGLPQRALRIQLETLPIGNHLLAIAPSHMELWMNTGTNNQATLFALVPVRQQGTTTILFIPAQAIHHGILAITIHTTTFTPPGDPRTLGTPLARITAVATTPPCSSIACVLVSPDWATIWQWLGALFLFIALVHRAYYHDDTTPMPYYAWWLIGASAVLQVVVALLDPPRWAYGTNALLITLIMAYILMLLLRATVPPLAARANIPLAPLALGTLIIMVVVAFGLRYGGRLYPESMHGDINFHTHRFNTALHVGSIYLTARNRGVDFPYPPAGYLTIAPIIILHPYTPHVLECTAALGESLSGIFIYALVMLARRTTNTTTQTTTRIALLATALYLFAAAGFMTNWWSFDTHIYTQAASLIYITGIVVFGSHMLTTQRPIAWHHSGIVALLLHGVLLGHFGFFINTTVAGGMITMVVWGAAWRGYAWARRIRWVWLWLFTGSLLFAAIFYYSAYIPLFMAHWHDVQTGGFEELSSRNPVTRQQLWHGVWFIGVIAHFGLFPLLSLPLGMWVMWQHAVQSRRTLSAPIGMRVVVVLMSISLVVSLFFAVVPFFTLSTQSTRWLMFSAWVVAIGGASGMYMMWQRGWAGRLVVGTMLCYVVWHSATYWLVPLAWRIRPPEPF